MAQSVLTVQIDEDIRHEAESLFNRIGLSMSSAINAFFCQALREQAIPFELRPYDDFYNSPESLAALAEVKLLINDPNGKTYTSVSELVDDIMNEDDD